MDKEEGFNDNKEAGESSDQELIVYKKENKKNYLNILPIVVLSVIGMFFIGAFGAKVYTNKVVKQEDCGQNKERSIENAIKAVHQSIVSISDEENKLMNESYEDGNLSGIILESDGIILTSYSLIKDFKKIFVKPASSGSKPLEGKLIFLNEDIDIAMIKIESTDLTPIKTIDFSKVKEGKLVLAVGNAIGSNYLGLVTMGIINSTSQKVSCSFTGEEYRVIQVDSKFSRGNYGGAVIDINGEVIGICSKYLTDIYGDGYYAIIDMETVKNIVLKVFEKIDRLGISGSFIKNDEAQGEYGIYVASVKKNGPAYNSDIRPTDIIIKINGEEIVNVEGSYEMISRHCNDNTVKLTILRNGIEVNKEIILE